MSNGKQKELVVHLEGHEGTLTIDAMNGRITTDPHMRPDWAEGLALALLGERHKFYETRFGKGSEAYNAALAAEAIDKRDLSWLGVNGEQEEVEIDADEEFRMDVVAKVIGADRDEGTMADDVIAEREVDSQRTSMTAEQHHALKEAATTGAGLSEEQEDKQAAAK